MDEGNRLQALFQTLGDANRLRIIRFVSDQRRSVSEIVGAVGLSQPLVSHHLRILREQSILNPTRDGPFIYYELSDARILEALGLFSEVLPNPKKLRPLRLKMFSCKEELLKAMSKK